MGSGDGTRDAELSGAFELVFGVAVRGGRELRGKKERRGSLMDGFRATMGMETGDYWWRVEKMHRKAFECMQEIEVCGKGEFWPWM